MVLSDQGWLVSRCIGEGRIAKEGADLRYELYTDPAWEGGEPAQTLLACCEQRGLDLATERGGTEGPTPRICVAHVNQRDRGLVEGAAA